MHRESTPIDGFDWSVSDEPITYPERDRVGACTRALDWRRSQSPHGRDCDWDWEAVEPVPADDPEWLHVGNLIARDRRLLRVFWHPESDGVRVERPQAPPPPMLVPASTPLAPEPIRFSVSVTESRHRSAVLARLRFLPSRGRESLTFPVMSLTIPPPLDMTPVKWEWTTRLAGSRLNVIDVPDAFLTTPPSERAPMIREAVQDLMRQIDANGGRRH